MTPMPPACAIAIARPASVTVSMAAERSGMPSSTVLVRRVRVSTCPGRTSEAAGTSRTSSKVRASRMVERCSMGAYIRPISILQGAKKRGPANVLAEPPSVLATQQARRRPSSRPTPHGAFASTSPVFMRSAHLSPGLKLSGSGWSPRGVHASLAPYLSVLAVKLRRQRCSPSHYPVRTYREQIGLAQGR